MLPENSDQEDILRRQADLRVPDAAKRSPGRGRRRVSCKKEIDQ